MLDVLRNKKDFRMRDFYKLLLKVLTISLILHTLPIKLVVNIFSKIVRFLFIF